MPPRSALQMWTGRSLELKVCFLVRFAKVGPAFFFLAAPTWLWRILSTGSVRNRLLRFLCTSRLSYLERFEEDANSTFAGTLPPRNLIVRPAKPFFSFIFPRSEGAWEIYRYYTLRYIYIYVYLYWSKQLCIHSLTPPHFFRGLPSQFPHPTPSS